jgi:predicted nucleic acid-binding protein
MTHLLDSNICSAHMRHPAGLAHRFFQYAGGIAMSTVVLAELYAGAYNHPNPTKLLALIAAQKPPTATAKISLSSSSRFSIHSLRFYLPSPSKTGGERCA